MADKNQPVHFFIFNKRVLIIMLLGLGDGWISAVYIGNIIAVLACVIYGMINWNNDESQNIED